MGWCIKANTGVHSKLTFSRANDLAKFLNVVSIWNTSVWSTRAHFCKTYTDICPRKLRAK